MKKCIKDFGIPNLNNEILSSVKKNIDHVVLCNFKSMKKTQKFRFFPDKEYLNYKLKEKIMDTPEVKRKSSINLKSNSSQLLKTVYSQYKHLSKFYADEKISVQDCRRKINS